MTRSNLKTHDLLSQGQKLDKKNVCWKFRPLTFSDGISTDRCKRQHNMFHSVSIPFIFYGDYVYLVFDLLATSSNSFSIFKVEKYSDLLRKLLVKTEDGLFLLPELFYVPPDRVLKLLIILFLVYIPLRWRQLGKIEWLIIRRHALVIIIMGEILLLMPLWLPFEKIRYNYYDCNWLHKSPYLCKV